MKKCFLFLPLFFILNFTYSQQSFSFFAFGDIPYNLPTDEADFQNFIRKINSEKSSFSIHLGDFKSGASLCDDETYMRMHNYFSQFSKPLIYTPGDNEWTDCSRPGCGNYDQEELLNKLRSVFFKGNNSLGNEKLILQSQSLMPGYEKFVENLYWQYSNVAFATVHVVGSNNHFNLDLKNQNKEFYERNAANIAWLKEVFAKANSNNQLGLVIAIHADMFYNKNGEIGTGFQSFLEELKNQTIAFGKPVLLLNGDSHEFIVEKPLLFDSKKNRKTVLNFTRVQVFGENDMHAVKIIVNPQNEQLFEIQPFIVK